MCMLVFNVSVLRAHAMFYNMLFEIVVAVAPTEILSDVAAMFKIYSDKQ